MTSDEANALVGQIRTAHRLSAAFYQRLFSMLAEVSDDQDLEFWYWEPSHTSRPCRSTTSPGDNWAWDMLPMFASRHVYRRVRGGGAAQGDVAVMFEVLLDDAFRPDARKRHGVRGEPNPLTLPVGSALVEVGVYRCTGDDVRTFDAIWDETDAPLSSVEGWQKLHARLDAKVLVLDLGQFISAGAIEISRRIAAL